MDFTKLLATFSAIEGKQVLAEAEKKETTWTDMKGKKHPATQVKGDKYTGKEAEKDEKDKEVKESVGLKPVDLAALIARMDAIVESEKVEEDDMEEGNEFSGELAKAKAAGKKEFEVDGKKYPVKESDEQDRELARKIRAMLPKYHRRMEPEDAYQEVANELGIDIERLYDILGRDDLSEGKKPDFLDVDKDGDKKEPMKKALKDKEEVKEAEDRPASKEKETTWTDKSGKKHPAKTVQGWQSVKADKEADKEKKETMKESAIAECGPMAGDYAGSEQNSGMSVNTNIDTRTGRKSVSVTADGEAADQLMQMLKLAGVSGAEHKEEMSEPEHGEVKVVSVPLAHAEGGFKFGGGDEEVKEYANDPNPQTQGIDAQLRQGTDLNKEKTMIKHNYRGGDNPYAMKEDNELARLEQEIAEGIESIKVKEAKKKDDKKSMKKKMK